MSEAAKSQSVSPTTADSETEQGAATVWQLFRLLVPARPLLILALTLGLYLLILVPRLIRLNDNDGLAVGHLHL